MVRTRARLSQIPVTKKTAVVGRVSRSDTWETMGIVRNERWVKDGGQCRHGLESLCRVLSPVEAHTFSMLRTHLTEDDASQDPPLRFWIKSCPAKHQSVHVLLVRPLYFDRLVPAWTVHNFNLIHCASVAERVVFIAPLLCNNSSAPAVSQTLSICRHVGPTWWSKTWFNIASCGGCWLYRALYNGRCHLSQPSF